MSLPFKTCETCPILQNCKGEDPITGYNKLIESNPLLSTALGSPFLPGTNFNISIIDIRENLNKISPLFTEGNPKNLDAETADLGFNCGRLSFAARLLISGNINNQNIRQHGKK
jgi:hypothetical protein